MKPTGFQRIVTLSEQYSSPVWHSYWQPHTWLKREEWYNRWCIHKSQPTSQCLGGCGVYTLVSENQTKQYSTKMHSTVSLNQPSQNELCPTDRRDQNYICDPPTRNELDCDLVNFWVQPISHRGCRTIVSIWAFQLNQFLQSFLHQKIHFLHTETVYKCH